MSKNHRGSGSPGSSSGSIHGDVSFIRATSASSVEKLNAPTSNQNFTSLSKMTQELSVQPHLHPPNHRLQSQQPKYAAEPPEGQHYKLKQSQSAGGASGDMARVPPHALVEGWSDREEALAAELEQAKIRVAQMEKTMRWWSDCTSSWREKWQKCKNNYNKAREENRIIKTKLELMAKEYARCKRDKSEQGDKDDSLFNVDSEISQFSSAHLEATIDISSKDIHADSKRQTDSFDDISESSSLLKPAVSHEDVSGACSDRHNVSFLDLQEEHKRIKEEFAQVQSKAAQAQENLVVMQRKLDEAHNMIQVEKLENCNHMNNIARLQEKLRDTEVKLQDRSLSLQELKMEMERSSKLHQDDLSRLTLQLEDETMSRSDLEKQIFDLRREIEQSQAQNISEWNKREQLESEKIFLQREIKKLKTQLADLEEESCKKNPDVKAVEFELTEKNKEIINLQYQHAKVKKTLTAVTTELDYQRRKGEQYESEVKALRIKIEKMKMDLAAAEDEVDKQRHEARKAQRSSEELQTQVDSLEVQVSHLQSRLRRNSKHGSVGTPRSTSMKSLDDPADLADSEND